MSIRFDGRVAVVTGAGAGLGRQHALALAARGAAVVVNDFGANRDGTGGSSSAAQAVVDEIRATGGSAIAHGADVADYTQVADMVAQAMATFGRVDILINNAGILRDKSFAKMDLAEFKTVLDVHLMGSVHCTKAVWDIMREQKYGRIVMTTSAAGLYGNFGQANYGAAKMALVGLMNVLHQEGVRSNIRVNTIAPIAATRMTEALLAADALDAIRPERVTPGVLFLCSGDAPSRVVLSAGGGSFSVATVMETAPCHLRDEELTPETIARRFGEIADWSSARAYSEAGEEVQRFINSAVEALRG
ncbi:NAD(P)-dependent dehydrogenase (short-subunit alcohol dehydrogenase family) [Paraburkholderia sp. BL27I4N3]|uniref:SDR family NAD(P)-dependent oxidoreductase n=1 Tax=Paraburkholderia sp. BL27I4N3 TaxID=1938805 RepID=UPI000E247697|nr:SDR family NAD(P)-dependent oxidoreductase [Paraburkholderia sp. BL27I4N3]REE23665.1 NAD(P)-dependent dehydrogenase (short-subunit alcohol dehydrogenase family) [Paraburkholderia sp. BL27I4N3]